MLHTAAFDRHLARREMDRLGKLNGMIKRVHLVRLTVRVCALAEILFDAEERMVIDLQMEELRELMKGDDGPAIELQTKRLSQVTDAFAARRTRGQWETC